jgi:predicted ATP-dependent serine protease
MNGKERRDDDTTGPARIETGIAGLDDILGGGLPQGHLYLIEGDPGTGKTTAALQFLLAGIRQGESVIYVTLSESRKELEEVALGAAHAGARPIEIPAEDSRHGGTPFSIAIPAFESCKEPA